MTGAKVTEGTRVTIEVIALEAGAVKVACIRAQAGRPLLLPDTPHDRIR